LPKVCVRRIFRKALTVLIRERSRDKLIELEMTMFLRSLAVSACLALAACSSTNTGSDGFMLTSATGEGETTAKKAAQLPQCSQPVGTVALIEKDIPALAGTGLTSPNAVLRQMITASNCFQIVDEAVQGARRGRGPRVDYYLTPDVLAQNENAGGIDGSLGRFLPGYAGQVASSVSVKFQNAEVAIYLTSAKTGVQVASASGKATTADSGVDFATLTRGRVAAGGVYASTDIGKTVTSAFFDAYANLVKQMLPPPQQVARGSKS
jgi:hypothetical protein